jgi:hypothetical protein
LSIRGMKESLIGTIHTTTAMCNVQYNLKLNLPVK